MDFSSDTPPSSEWNYTPALPLADPSIFKWPPDPRFLVRWLGRNWLTLSERMMMVIVAVALWFFAYPSLEAAQTFAFGWIAQAWAINMALMSVVAGGLHWYFYTRKGQAKELKFDHREQAKGNRLWKFSNQVHDNMFWSLTSGVAQLTAFQVATMWLMANGYIPTLPATFTFVWFLILLFLTPLWLSFHFYWVHRLIHFLWMFKNVHHLHHRNVNVGPWSGFVMHPVEHLFFYSGILIQFILPSHPCMLSSTCSR